jgi:signal transduction histidine kinase
MVDRIHRLATEMSTLVHALLDVALIERGEFELHRRPGNLTSLCRARGRLAASIADRKGVTMDLDLEDVPDTLVDVQRMNLVLDNLLSNAIKHGPPESRVCLSCASAGDEIHIEVEDAGPGLPEYVRERLMRTGEGPDLDREGGEKSPGLGLFLVKKLVLAHGGRVGVAGTGPGTTVRVVMPTG